MKKETVAGSDARDDTTGQPAAVGHSSQGDSALHDSYWQLSPFPGLGSGI